MDFLFIRSKIACSHMALLTFWKWVWGVKTEKEKMNLKGPSSVW
jgi:hypothetical protein